MDINNFKNFSIFNEKSIKSMQSTGKKFKELAEQVKRAGEKSLKVNKVLIDFEYPPFDHFNLFMILDLIEILPLENPDDINEEYFNNMILEYFDHEHLDYLKDDIDNYNLSKDDRKIFKNILLGYKNEQYDLIIPTLLSRVEGLVYKNIGFEGKSTYGNFNKIIDEVINNYKLKHSIYDDSEFIKIKEYYKEGLKRQFTFNDPDNEKINRHAIMHGHSSQYGTKINSVKLLLHFEYLHYCLLELSEQEKNRIKQLL